MKQVPGKVEERPLVEQADKLVEKLAGHGVFARMRGRVQGFPLWELLDLDSENTPTKSLRLFDAYMADLRVMRHLVVWLRCHGYRHAGEELEHALSDSTYRMWCEDIPIEETRVATVLMFDPESIKRISRWWHSKNGQWELPHWRNPQPMSAETAEILATYPTLGQEGFWREDALPFVALRRDIMNPLLGAASPLAQKVFAELSWSGPYFPLYTQGGCKKPTERGIYENGAWAYLLTGYDQGEVLSWFPRELQSKLATWQVQVPLCHLRGVAMVHAGIGFYPEAEHPRWKKLSASRASRGVSAGMGVVVAPTDNCTSEGRFTLQSYTY